MILFSLVLFRQRLRPHIKPITLAVLAGSMNAYFENWALLYVCMICILLMIVWKFSLVPALIIALSGYILSVIVTTSILFFCVVTQVAAFADLKEDNLTTNIILLFIVLVKFGLVMAIRKRRLGFTFLSNYTKISLNSENAGFYLFIIVVILGIAYRQTYPGSVLSALMPIEMLSMAIVLFIYVMLGKELSFQR